MKKRTFPVLIAIVLLCTVLICSCHKNLIKDVATPEIKYGEFPFKLVYQLDDEIITVEDTYICEYKGARWNWNQGGYRVWKGYIKGTGNDSVIVMQDGEDTIEITVGYAEHYMGLTPSGFEPYSPYVLKCTPDGGAFELQTDEQVKIISFEQSLPIENALLKDGVVIWRTGDSLTPSV